MWIKLLIGLGFRLRCPAHLKYGMWLEPTQASTAGALRRASARKKLEAKGGQRGCSNQRARFGLERGVVGHLVCAMRYGCFAAIRSVPRLSPEGRLGEFVAVNSSHWPRPDGAGPMPATATSAATRIAAARADAGGRAERRLDGAYGEYARRRRPAPPAAKRSSDLGWTACGSSWALGRPGASLTRARMRRSKNFGAPVGQSQQLVHSFVLPCGATLAKSLLCLTRQSN
jgi:hypothetical protein